MSIMTERIIEVTCDAEDVVVCTVSATHAERIRQSNTGRALAWSHDVEVMSFERCEWTGLVTEHLFTNAGIAEWQCPMCRTVYTRDAS